MLLPALHGTAGNKSHGVRDSVAEEWSGRDCAASTPMMFSNPLLSKNGSDIGIPGSHYESPVRTLPGLPIYYHGDLSRSDAEHRVLVTGIDGDFLVTRNSLTNDFLLSLCMNERVYHRKILWGGKGVNVLQQRAVSLEMTAPVDQQDGYCTPSNLY